MTLRIINGSKTFKYTFTLIQKVTNVSYMEVFSHWLSSLTEYYARSIDCNPASTHKYNDHLKSILKPLIMQCSSHFQQCSMTRSLVHPQVIDVGKDSRQWWPDSRAYQIEIMLEYVNELTICGAQRITFGLFTLLPVIRDLGRPNSKTTHATGSH